MIRNILVVNVFTQLPVPEATIAIAIPIMILSKGFLKTY